MGCERCGWVRCAEKPSDVCQACYLWWQRHHGPPAAICGHAHHYAKGLCLQCWRNVPERAEKRKATARAYNVSERGRERHRARRRKSDPNATLERKDGPCENTGCSYVGPLDWDHDHSTGLFRGWLCRNCNVALGNLKDSPMRILGLNAYITGPRPGVRHT